MADALRDLPALPLAAWEDTRLQLHLMSQIAGKVRLALHPKLNHWWHVTLYLSARGFTTGAMPRGEETLELALDLVDHALVITTSKGEVEKVPLAGQSIATFYAEVMARVGVPIHAVPYKCKSTIPFADDRVHAAYDRAAVERAFEALRRIDPVFREFRGRWLGKASPVHLFWHSFDLAVTRFSGRRAPPIPGADRSTREAYSHECASAGFWFGDDDVPEAAFYSYVAPAPAGLTARALRPASARWLDVRGAPMALLRYDDLRASPDPRATLLEFLESAFEAETVEWPAP